MLLKQIGAKQWFVLVLLIAFGAVIRLSFISFPSAMVFDENYFARFTSYYDQGAVYLDIHPPLGKLIFLLAGHIKGGSYTLRDKTLGASYPPDFPYIAMRAASGVAGIALIPTLFFLMLAIGASVRASLIAAFFAAFENSLVLYSRLILMDSWLLLFSFLSILLGAIFLRKSDGAAIKIDRYFLLSAAAAGLALAVKWTALLPLSFLIVIALSYRRPSIGAVVTMAKFSVISVIAYIFVFLFHFMLLPIDGHEALNSFLVPTSVEAIKENIGNLPSILQTPFLFTSSFLVNNLESFVSNASALGNNSWYAWPFMAPSIRYWSDNKHSIYFFGNPVIWLGGFVGIILVLIGKLKTAKKTVSPSMPKANLIIIWGYLISWLPFALIKRPMYIYTYLPALVFLMLNLAFLADWWWSRLNKCHKTLAAVLVIIGFLAISPVTYGFKNSAVSDISSQLQLQGDLPTAVNFCDLAGGKLILLHGGNCQELERKFESFQKP